MGSSVLTVRILNGRFLVFRSFATPSRSKIASSFVYNNNNDISPAKELSNKGTHTNWKERGSGLMTRVLPGKEEKTCQCIMIFLLNYNDVFILFH